MDQREIARKVKTTTPKTYQKSRESVSDEGVGGTLFK